MTMIQRYKLFPLAIALVVTIAVSSSVLAAKIRKQAENDRRDVKYQQDHRSLRAVEEQPQPQQSSSSEHNIYQTTDRYHRSLGLFSRNKKSSEPETTQIKVNSCSDVGSLHLPRTETTEYLWKEYELLLEMKELKKQYTLPQLKTLEDPYYGVWKDHNLVRDYISIWDDKGFHVKGREDHAANHYVSPKKYEPKNVIHLEGNFVAFVSIFSGNYGHFLHDHLPFLAYFRAKVSPDTKFLLIYTEKDQERLRFIDPEFERRVLWIKAGQVFKIKGTITYDDEYVPPYRLPLITPYLREWLHDTHPMNSGNPIDNPEQKTIVFYSRLGDDKVKHGRTVEPQHEQGILRIIRESMKKYNRPEELVIYNGQENGKQMSLENQFKLFRSATAAIGPHGSGLANIIWMDPSPTLDDCHDRPKVLEFLVSNELERVQDGGTHRTYYALYAFPVRYEYHHVFYAPKSTSESTYVDLTHIQAALDDMWGPQKVAGSDENEGGEETKEAERRI